MESPQTKDERVSKGASDAPSKEEGCGLSPYDVPGDWIDLIGTGQIKKKVSHRLCLNTFINSSQFIDISFAVYF